uniref:Zinc knuckle CX2CX4HX4C domain-containing protein n=1 Tax=Cannabis sativa TaxID=3483 RepID=A0A803QJP0_CANSA
MDNLLNDMNHTLTLTESEREVQTLPTGLSIGRNAPPNHVLYARVISARDINRKTFKIKMSGFWKGQFPVTITDHHSGLFLVSFGCLGDLRKILLLEPWHFQNHLIVLSSPTALHAASPESMILTPFWIQLHRLPFLSKTKQMAEWAGNLLGTYVDVHEDSLNEGWGPFLRFRAILDISKPLLRGKMVKLQDSQDEFWLEFRYERLPEFCFECGTIGHPFESCHTFLEQIYNGVEPLLEYGPSMIGSPLPESNYDRYRTDFFKGGVWPLMTRLAKKSFTAVIPNLSTIPLNLPNNLTTREYSNPPQPHSSLTSSSSSTHVSTFNTVPMTTGVTPSKEASVIPFPPYLTLKPMIATYPPTPQTVKSFPHTSSLPVSFPSIPSTPSTIVSTFPSAAGQSPRSLSKGKAVLEYDIGTENINPNKQFKRQIDSESLRNVLKRCRSNVHSTQLASSAPTSTSTLPVSCVNDLDSVESQSDVSAVVAPQHRAQP